MSIAQRLLKTIVEAIGREVTLEAVKEQSLTESLGLTSVDALEVLIRVEGEFGIHIDDADLSANLLHSFSNLERYVNSKLELAKAG